MLVYVAYCQRDSSYYFSSRLDREGHREIDHERSSAVHAEIDFALLATDGPADKSTWSNIRIRESVSVSLCEFWTFCSILSIITLSRCIQSDINIRRFSAEIATEQITRVSQFVAFCIFICKSLTLIYHFFNIICVNKIMAKVSSLQYL